MCNENIEIVSSSYVYTVSGSVQIFINGDDGSSDREDDVEHSCLNAIIEFITSTEFTTEGMTPPPIVLLISSGTKRRRRRKCRVHWRVIHHYWKVGTQVIYKSKMVKSKLGLCKSQE